MGGDSICTAVARRAGIFVAESFSQWLARAQLLSSGVTSERELKILVIGGGRDFVQAEVNDTGLKAELVSVDDFATAEIEEHLLQARGSNRSLVVVAETSDALARSLIERHQELAEYTITCDLRYPEYLHALFVALADPEPSSESVINPVKPRIDRELVDRVRVETDRELSDHQAKRLLKAYHIRVSRQAPTGTPTGAMKLAKKIGLPVTLVGSNQDLRQAQSAADVKRLSTLLLQSQTEHAPTILVREFFPEVPRVQVRVYLEKGLGLAIRVNDSFALAPLVRSDANLLAQATLARRAKDREALADLLLKISACATDEEATFELDIHLSPEPAVVSASGILRKKSGD